MKQPSSTMVVVVYNLIDEITPCFSIICIDAIFGEVMTCFLVLY